MADLYTKFNEMNLQLQGDDLNLIKTKSVISAFFSNFPNLCELRRKGRINEQNVEVYWHHLELHHQDFIERLEDILSLEVPDWMTNPLSGVENAELQLQEEFLALGARMARHSRNAHIRPAAHGSVQEQERGLRGSTRASLYAGTATCAQLLHRLWAKFRIPSAASRRPSSLTKLCFAAVNSTEDASTAGISGSSAGPAARPNGWLPTRFHFVLEEGRPKRIGHSVHNSPSALCGELVITAVNRIKSRPLSDRLFRQLCEENGEDFHRLLFHTEVRWLSKGTCLSRFYNLYASVLEFFEKEDASLCANLKKFEGDIAYMADLYTKFNEMNLQLQGDDLNLIKTKSVISAFVPEFHIGDILKTISPGGVLQLSESLRIKEERANQ
ncbi:hypothetical protein M513_12153 [Trichuris suis]|uniref:Uncharacterized protein n=1 Tax=Trichuris suis TaxID=68888 RepID=A0A085LPR7_9BILA|nr:hypothetical protein M513_12153 [Trichuris suis]